MLPVNGSLAPIPSSTCGPGPKSSRRHKSLVLDDEGNAETRENRRKAGIHASIIGAGNHVVLDCVGDHVSRRLARIHVEARDAVGVVVVELQPGTLGVV